MTDAGIPFADTAALRPAAGSSGAPASDGYAELAALLWQERELLEELLYRLVAQQHVLSGGDPRWLARADADVVDAVTCVRAHEVVRSAELDVLTHRHGMPTESTLREVAATAPEPWSTVLTDHRETLRALTLEIESVTAENRRMLQAGEQATRAALDALAGTPEPTRAFGPTRAAAGRPFILDQQA